MSRIALGRTMRWLASTVRMPRRGGAPALVIVRHHRVYPDGERPLYRLGVAAGVLQAQLHYLANQGLAPITVTDGLTWLAGASSGVRVALTFDDGYADNVTLALPLLAACGGRATFYLAAGLIETRTAPWWDRLAWMLEHTRAVALEVEWEGFAWRGPVAGRSAQEAALPALLRAMRCPPEVREARLAQLARRLGVMDEPPCALGTWTECRALREAGMEIGAHTLTHPFLTTLPREGQREEIEGSVDLIERALGVRPAGLAYPAGDHDDTTVDVVRACGLAHAVTTRRGANGRDADPLRLCRRALPEAACLAPGDRFSHRLVRAELEGAFDRMRGAGATS